MAESPSGVEHDERRHEERDIRLRPIIVMGIGLVVLAGASLLAMVLLFDYLAARRVELAPPPSPILETGRPPPEPRLQTSPQQDMRVMRRQEDAMLQSYSWVDRQAGVVRIPIARAMEILVERGLPARSADDQGSAGDHQGRLTEAGGR
jgi:hypothetical protein